ncbi:MAG: superoxide dismutase family protein [Clostridia bacterium]|jgi:Cu-Zn family superoxide dismutase|nr:superoxide dismutase family protein [Clostridia bacterium]
MAQFGANQLQNLLRRIPDARAIVNGSQDYPDIQGEVSFYQTDSGTIVMAEIEGLPDENQLCSFNIYGFHIHRGGSCTGNANDPFADVGEHYNTNGCPHPAHAGDLPPLFGNEGYAFMIFLTDRFTVNEVIGRSVIIHIAPDNFTDQTTGGARSKIACGEIQPLATMFR